MDFTQIASLDKRKTADLLVLPFFKGKDRAEAAFKNKLQAQYEPPIEMGDFNGKESETLLIYPSKQEEKRWLLLGLGEAEKVSVESLRRSFSSVVKLCHKQKLSSVNIIVPAIEAFEDEGVVRGLVEGLLLTNYSFDALKGSVGKEEASPLLNKATLITPSKSVLNTANKYLTICEGVYFARDLVNGNADDITPQYLSKVALGLTKTLPSVKTTVFDKKQIEKEKMGLLLAVNRGAASEPAFIIVEYAGNPKSKDKTVIVGKGITFDSGGLNIKTSGMETMKGDMGGAATALATIYTAARLNLKTNITAVIPTTENAVGSKSYKPGDVYKSYLGKTVEIGNTDAEGRLILADALAYVVDKIKPTRIIDFATLTGAIIVALGNEPMGLFSNNDALSDSLIRAGSASYERVWRMPLCDEYKEKLKSDVADLKNVGGKGGGAITAALFLQEFVDSTPWAHLDIAGTAFLEEPKRYHGKGGTGSGVRLMIDFLEQQ